MVAKKIQHRKGLATDDQSFLIAIVAKTMHLTKGEAEVLSVLCAQQNGFSPSAKFLMAKTSMSHGGIYKARAALNNMGIIGESDTNIVIDWSRIRILSTLDPCATSRKARVAPVAQEMPSLSWRSKVPAIYDKVIDFFVYHPDEKVEEGCVVEETIQDFFTSLSKTDVDDVFKYLKETL